jgi:hypothetical protein
MHYGDQEEKQGGRVAGKDNQMQTGKRPNQEGDFRQRRKGKAAPSSEPQSEITSVLVAPEKGKQDQKDETGRGLEERDAEQALILYHDALPPGRTWGRYGARAVTRLGSDGVKF